MSTADETTDGAPALAAPAKAKAKAKAVPSLEGLCVSAFVRQWHPSRSLEALGGPPRGTELAKKLWAALKAEQAKAGEPITCAAMYPFVRTCWQVEALDLSDGGKWLLDLSLGALRYAPSLRSVRLTACRFVSDDGLAFTPGLQLHTLDVSWTQVTDNALGTHLARCPTLTSLNFTGNAAVTDRGVASILGLTGLQRLALCATGITDASLDYLTYYTRYPDTQKGVQGIDGLKWLELSNTAISDTGVGKLVATLDEDGKPYGKVFKSLEYLGLSMTNGVGPAAIRQVKMKYGLDTPLPNAQRTLAKSNAVALDARDWVIRFCPTKDRQLPAPQRSWEQARMVNYIAQYTKEMNESASVLARLNAGLPPQQPSGGEPDSKRLKTGAA